MFNGRRQPSCDGSSRMTRECQVRFFEGLGVKLPGPTRQRRKLLEAGVGFAHRTTLIFRYSFLRGSSAGFT